MATKKQKQIDYMVGEINRAMHSSGLELSISVNPTTGSGYRILRFLSGERCSTPLFTNVKESRIISTLEIMLTSIDFVGISQL